MLKIEKFVGEGFDPTNKIELTVISQIDTVSDSKAIKAKIPAQKRRSSFTFQKSSSHRQLQCLRVKGFLKSFFKLLTNARFSLLVFITSLECILVATLAVSIKNFSPFSLSNQLFNTRNIKKKLIN